MKKNTTHGRWGRAGGVLPSVIGRFGQGSLFLMTVCSSAYALEIEVPSVAVTTVDQEKTFSSSGHDAIALNGVLDVADTFTISVTSGTLSLSGTSGLTFTAGDGLLDSTMTFSGALADVNAALEGLSYVPSSGVAGSVTMNMAVAGTQSVANSLKLSVNAVIDAEAARDQILAGVSTLADPTQPGRMVVYGDSACSISNYPSANIDNPMVAGARWGAGKVIAMPDHQWLNMGSYGGDASTGTFYTNGIAWLAGSTSQAIKVVTYNNQANADWLVAQGFTNVVNTNAANLATDLVDADVFVAGWIGTSISQSMSDTIRDYVTAGGGLFISEYGPGYSWWWGKSTEDIPGNILLREAGIGFTQAWPAGGVQTINRASGQMTGDDVLAIIQTPGSYSESDKNLAASIFDKLNAVLKDSDPLQLRLDDVFWTKIATINPTPTTPVSDSLEKALLNREGQMLRDLPVAQMTAHRTALPVGVSAARVNKSVTLPETVNGHDYWVIDTGLYAAPGEVVSITVPAALVGIGLDVQVGHLRTDTGDANYYTMPYQQLFFDVDSATFDVASPHGGLLMFVAPSGTEWTGAQSVQVDGAVEAPYFEYGVNTNAEWVAGVRDRETPFGVLVSDTHVLVIESEQYLRSLDNPEGVMEIHRNMIWWIDDFYNYHRGRPLRTHHDYQPVGGASSMPLSYGMGSNITDYNSLVVNGEALTMHEHGHHADHGNLMFSEFSETTPNMGGKYAQQKYLPFSWKQELAVGRINNYQRSLTDDLWNHYSHYAVDVKGTFVDSIGEVFGWDNVRTIVHTISADSSISTDQDKKDAWLIHTSQLVGYDVSAFLEAWQLSFSAEALSTVSTLPKWNMVEIVGEDLVVKQDTPVTFGNPSVNDFSYDGTLTFNGIGNPSNGLLVNHGDGTYTYTPNNGFTGDDTIQYTVSNGLGNVFTGTIAVTVNAASAYPTLEAGDTHAGTSAWKTVDLEQSFTSMVVVAQAVVSDGAPPVVTRVRNASGSSFELMLQRVDGQSGDVDNVQVRYLVVEEGVYDLDTHGIKMEAVKYTSSVTDTAGSFVGETRTMAHNLFDHYFIPTVFGQVMTYNDPSWSSFWYKKVSDQIQVGKHVGEDPDTTRADETVGYIIMEAGSLQIGDYRFQVGSLGHDGYSGFGGLSRSTSSHDFTRFPDISTALVAADISVPWGGSNPGDEGFWVVQKPAGSGNSVAASIVEDQLNDSEQDAGSKGGSYLLVSYMGEAPVLGDDAAVALEGYSTLIDVLANDSSGLGGSLTVTGFTQPANGSVVNNGDGTFTYTPNASFTGNDYFTYTTSNGNGTDVAVVSLDVQASQSSQAGLVREKWTGLGGNNVSDLTNNANYPDSPNTSTIMASFESPTGDGDSYGQRIRGYLVPPTTGDYTFWVASDDDSDLYLSSDHSVANAVRIAYVDGWTSEKNWTQKSSQQSAVITLEAGKAYYMEALHKEGGGGDHFAVAWQGPGITQGVIGSPHLHTVGNVGPSVLNQIADVQVNEDAADTVIDLSNVFEDADVGDPLTIELAGNTNGSLVGAVLNGTLLTLSYAPGQYGTAQISVRALDRLNTVAVDTFQVEVISSNLPPVLEDASFAVSENVAPGTSIGTLTATDPNAGDSLSYAITAGNTGGDLSIDAVSGEITAAGALNHEVLSSYVLTVEVTDIEGLSDTATVTVTVTDVDESSDTGVAAWEEAVHQGSSFAHKRTAPLAGNTTESLDLSGISGDATYEFIVDAEDIGQAAVHLLDGNGWSLRFEQWSNTSKLGVTRYGFADYQLSVEPDQSVASPYGSVHHIVYVVDSVNTQTSVYVNGVLVGTLNQVPPMNGASMTLGDGNLRNDSDPGILVFAAYSSALDAAEVREHTSAWFGPNAAPLASDAILAVAENAVAGTSVGTVAAVDADAGDTLSYAITAGNAGGEFAIDSGTGEITTTTLLDHETTAQYVLTVEVNDDGIPVESDSATITINISDVNEAPVANDAGGSISEDAAAGSAVTTVIASDADAAETLSYAITAGNGSGLFAIDTAGNITTTGSLDYESSAQHVMTVTVTDSGSLSDIATVTVDVTDVNEAPVASDGSGSVDENVSTGTAVTSVAASDVDAGDSLTYAIVSGNTGGAFAIDSNSGAVTTAGAIDYEVLSSYTLTVSVTDSGALSDTAEINITVNDIMEVTTPVVQTGSASAIGQTSADIGYTVSDDGGEAPALTVYYGTSDGGTTPANWDSSVAQGAKSNGSYVASLTGLTEGTTYYFTIQASNSAGTVWGSSGSFNTEADTSPKLVSTTVSGVSSDSWTTVDLGQNYTSAVIVATPVYDGSTQVPVVTRIRNASGSSFELKLDRADGLTTAINMDVSVIAVEEGVYTQAADGVTMEAVKYTSTVTAENNSWVGEARSYQNSYTNPVVVGQVMSANDANWSVFYSMGSSRTAPANASVLNLGKHVGEDPNTSRANETIGYIVIESGNGTINGVAYEAALGADTVRGFGNSSNPYSYSLSGTLSSASAAAASISGMDGGNGAWAVLSGSPALTASSIGLHAAEDQMNDSEQSHTTTQVGYIVFE